MAQKVIKEEIVEETAVEVANDIIEGAAKLNLDIDDIIGDDPSLKTVFKVVGVAAGTVGSATAGYIAAKRNVFGAMRENRQEKRYQKAKDLVDRYEHPELYVQDDSEETEEPVKKSKKK